MGDNLIVTLTRGESGVLRSDKSGRRMIETILLNSLAGQRR